MPFKLAKKAGSLITAQTDGSWPIALAKAVERERGTDSKYNMHGIDLVVDKKSSLYLDGATVDWYEGLDRRGFTFDNPNAVKTCGCGGSFQA